MFITTLQLKIPPLHLCPLLLIQRHPRLHCLKLLFISEFKSLCFFGYGFKWYLRPAITIATLYYINIINQQIRLILGGYPSLKLFKVNAVQWIWTDVELPSWALSFALSFWLTSRPEVCTACGVWLGYRFPMVSYGRNRISPVEVPVLATKNYGRNSGLKPGNIEWIVALQVYFCWF